LRRLIGQCGARPEIEILAEMCLRDAADAIEAEIKVPA
jgi:hypothetical protein